MNLREAQQRIRDEEMPASEAAQLLDQVDDNHCIHFRGGECKQIDFCTATSADPLASMP